MPRHTVANVLAEKSFDSGVNMQSLARSVAAYLLETGRTGELSSLLRDVQQIRAENGIIEVTAISASGLSEASRRDIEAKIKQLMPKAQTVIISEQRDPKIVAGVRLELPHQQLDLSVRGTLNRFKQLTATGV